MQQNDEGWNWKEKEELLHTLEGISESLHEISISLSLARERHLEWEKLKSLVQPAAVAFLRSVLKEEDVT